MLKDGQIFSLMARHAVILTRSLNTDCIHVTVYTIQEVQNKSEPERNWGSSCVGRILSSSLRYRRRKNDATQTTALSIP